MRISTFFALLLLARTAQATLVTIKVEVNVTSYFDYPTGIYLAMPPTGGIVSFTFDIDQLSVMDYGATTISTFGGVMGATWSASFTSLIPHDPASGAYGPLSNSYVFPNVSDYASTFIEEGASQANTYAADGTNVAAYHVEVRATRRSAPRSGDGSSDYSFDRTSLLDFYRSFAASGEAVSFSESYQNYTLVNGAAVYSDGKLWSDYSGKVIDVIDHVAAVPEPSSGGLLLAGLSLFMICRGRRFMPLLSIR